MALVCVLTTHIKYQGFNLSFYHLLQHCNVKALPHVHVSPVHKAVDPGEALPGVSHGDALAIQIPADGGGRVATSHTLQR